MNVCGLDLSTKQLDFVLLDETTNAATHHRRRLDLQPGNATTRIRRIRDQLPARTSWDDSGIVLVAIEEPFNRMSMSGQVPILMAIGAVLACLPADQGELPVALLRADDWRKACGLPIRGARPDLKRAAVDFARRNWADVPARLDDNMADAFGLAWAGRELWELRERERRAA